MKNLVLETRNDYTLIARVRENFTVHEYIVAWCYDRESDSWCQGHYFFDIEDAVEYFKTK